MDTRILKLLELELIQELIEEGGNQEIGEESEKRDIGSFYIPKPMLKMYNSMMEQLRGLK